VEGDTMRCLAFAAFLLWVAVGLSGADESPYFRLEQATTSGKVQVTGTNILRRPIVAYVVVAERSHQRVVWQGVYTGSDTLGAGKTVTLGDIAASATLEQVKVFVDYIRLGDGTTWGDAETDQAKEITARFQK